MISRASDQGEGFYHVLPKSNGQGVRFSRPASYRGLPNILKLNPFQFLGQERQELARKEAERRQLEACCSESCESLHVSW